MTIRQRQSCPIGFRIWQRAWPLIAIWVVVFWRLGYVSLLDPDEAHYAQISKEMLSTQTWLVPLLNGQPFIDKPVLFHWLQGLSFHTFGITAFAARLPSALAALSLIWTTYWSGRELFDRETGARAALMLLTMPATFALASIGLLDMLFTAFLFGAAALLIVAARKDRPALQWPAYGLLSLAMLTKGPVALLLLAAAFVCAVIFVRGVRADLHALRWIVGPFCAIVLAGPWFAWTWWRFGAEFVRHYFVEGHLWYVTHPFPFRESNHFFYLRTVFGAFMPWSVLAVGRGIDLARRRRRFADESESLLWTWVVVVLTVFTVARFKLDHYIYPAAPAICLVAARAWAAALQDDETSFWQPLSIAAIPIALIVTGTVLAFSMFELELRVDRASVLLPFVMVAGSTLFLGALWNARGRPPRTLHILGGTLVLAYGCVVWFGFPVLENVRPTADVGRWIANHEPVDAPVGAFQVDEWEASLNFYSDRRVEPLPDVDAVRRVLASSGSVVTRRRDYRALLAMGLPVRVVYGRDAVIGRTGKGLRRQVWGQLVVVKSSGTPPDRAIGLARSVDR